MTTRGKIEELLRELDFVKDFHVQVISAPDRRVTTEVSQLKIRVWVTQHIYVAHLLTEGTTIQQLIKKLCIGSHYRVLMDVYEQ